jgi:hypothetical protein
MVQRGARRQHQRGAMMVRISAVVTLTTPGRIGWDSDVLKLPRLSPVVLQCGRGFSLRRSARRNKEKAPTLAVKGPFRSRLQDVFSLGRHCNNNARARAKFQRTVVQRDGETIRLNRDEKRSRPNSRGHRSTGPKLQDRANDVKPVLHICNVEREICFRVRQISVGVVGGDQGGQKKEAPRWRQRGPDEIGWRWGLSRPIR